VEIARSLPCLQRRDLGQVGIAEHWAEGVRVGIDFVWLKRVGDRKLVRRRTHRGER